MLFVFVLGINQYYLPFLHNHAEEKQAGFTGHFDCL